MHDITRTQYYSKKTAPCLNCMDRFLGCHSQCKKYITWKTQHDAERLKRQEEAMKQKILNEFINDEIIKLKKGIGRRQKR